ncbi:hypothetical protein ABN763_09750 [Spongiivirga sp. MCCC 1A20706]|uniref:hypothetical protein n=1 Tax=Spongiivirga sp. MCCC 1A20706 TaxID=3160963 RepID=UPI0039774A1D
MTLRIYIASAIICLSVFKANGQVLINNAEDLRSLELTPMETAYLHLNSNVLFPGEYLYYSFYCIDASTYKLSNISKVGYVQLINSSGETILNQKIRLNKGKGQGELFIPSSLNSGNYKLIGFTRWMSNENIDQLFQSDILLVNPYRTNQFSDANTTLSEESMTEKPNASLSDSIVGISIGKNSFSPRSNLQLTVQNLKGTLGAGSYSISVRKVDDLNIPAPTNPIQYSNKYAKLSKKISKKIGDTLVIPEQKGELVSYQLIDNQRQQPKPNVELAVSLPGKRNEIKYAKTDQSGTFYSYYKSPIASDNIYVQLITEDNSTHTLKNSKLSDRLINTKLLTFANHKVSTTDSILIKNRSIHNQIQNAYRINKKDTLVSSEPENPFSSDIPESFVLDEYKRFKTMKETFVEIVVNVSIKKRDGKDVIWIDENTLSNSRRYKIEYLAPLVLVDGIYIKDQQTILDFDATKVKAVYLLRDRFSLGSKAFKGMIYLETFDQQNQPLITNETILVAKGNFAQEDRRYFNQLYSDNTEDNRAPDFRTQLYWNPNFNLKDDEINFDCYTSDVKGDFEIILNGYTSYGKPIHLRKTFRVE